MFRLFHVEQRTLFTTARLENGPAASSQDREGNPETAGPDLLVTEQVPVWFYRQEAYVPLSVLDPGRVEA